ncbi:serine hydrolase [Nonomuraea sp. NPDC001684]
MSLTATPAMAATAAAEGPSLRAMLDKVVAGGAVAAIAEVRDGDRTWRAASGKATMNSARPAPVDGRFRAGSVTKSFTASVVLQLVGEGRLHLSDSVERWLPNRRSGTISSPTTHG